MSEATVPIRGARRGLPRPIGRVLRRVGRRLRVNSMLRGLGTTAMVLAIVAAAGMAADFAWDLGGAVRWGIWVAWVLSGGVVLAIGVVRPMVRRLPAFDLAAAAEDGHPELGESLTGAVALLGEGAPHGSPELIDALADRAARSIPSLRPVGAISGARAVRRLGLGLLMVGLVVVPALVRPGSFGVLARRFLMPWADIGRLARFVVAVEPGDRVVAAGSEVTFTAEVRPLLAAGFGQTPESARLTWEAEAGQGRQSLEMSPQPGSGPGSAQWLDSSARRFTLTMPRVGGTIEYRVTSGPASSRRHRITALEPPAAGSIAARIEPPAYTGRTAGQARDPARIEAFEGSRVTLEIAATRPVRSVEVGWPGETGKPSASMPATLADGGRRASVSVVAMASGPYSLEMRDEHGIGSRPDDTRRLIVQPDTPPVVSVRGVDELKEVNPRDTVNLGFTARDDVAVASVEMHYTVVRAGSQSAEPEAGRREVATTGLGSPTARGVAALSMGPMGLKPGDRVSYRLRVADNRPAPKGPNVTWTPAKELAVIAGAEPIAVRLARLRRSAIESALERLNKDVAAGRQDTERMRQAAESSRRGEARWDAGRRRAVEQRERTLRDVIERLKQLARKMAEDPATRELARPARQIAELEAEASRAMLERARHEDDPARISENLRQAENRLASAAERLEELRRRFHEQDREVARRGKLQELADRQQRLAEESEAEPPRGRVELDRLQARQNAVRNELDALVRQTPELRGSLLEAEAREADRLVRAARELAARQREEARRAGDPSPHAAELKAIAAEQRRLEDDARRVALDVDPPLTENGRGRLNVGEIRQAAEPIERGDVEQARQRLEAAENELRRLARDVEDLPGDPKSLAQRLVRRQDALNGEIGEALNRLREKDKLSKDEKDALADRLKSLGRRQESIAGLAASIRPPEGPSSRSRFPEQAMREAVDKTRRAAEAFRQPVAQVIDERKNEARQALDRLANELPDWWRRSEPDRQKFDEARRITNELFNQVSQHLRETEPRPDRPATAAKAAEELGRRLGDAPDRLAQGLRALREMEPEPRVQPQRDRAVRAGEAMERALRDLRDAGQREAARAALGAAEQQAHAAMDRLDHKLNGRSPADDLAAELARDQRELVDRLARGGGVVAEGASEDQRRIANALRDLNVPDAALDRADAVRQAERAARALARPGAGAGGLEAAKAATQAADRLAARLGGRPSSRERAAALARAERALDEPEALADPSALATRQRAIAAELALLPVVKKEEAAGRVAGALELDERAGQIDEEPGASRPSPSALAVAHERAAEALDALAARALTAEAKATAATSGKHPAGTAGPDPELLLKPDHVAAARDLVRRQRQLRERFLAVLGRHVEPQESVRRDSVAVGQELMQLRDRIRPISDRGVYPAFEAAHHLRAYAAQAMEQAAEHLAQGQVPYARDAQRRASESIERGAQHAEDLGAALRAEQMAMAAAAPTATAGANRPLGAAREAIARAVRQVEQARDPSQAGRGAAAAARAAMREAARDLMAAAQEADPGAGTGAMADLDADGAGDPLEPGSQPPASSPRDGPSRPGQAADTDLAELKDAIRRGTGRTWGELPGHLRTEILQSAHGGYREDYARLIQLYFREIASGAGAKPVE